MNNDTFELSPPMPNDGQYDALLSDGQNQTHLVGRTAPINIPVRSKMGLMDLRLATIAMMGMSGVCHQTLRSPKDNVVNTKGCITGEFVPPPKARYFAPPDKEEGRSTPKQRKALSKKLKKK